MGLHHRLVRAAISVLAAAVVYVLLLAFPEPLFSHSVTYSGITFFSHGPVPGSAAIVGRDVRARLQGAELYDPTLKSRVFIVGSRRLWWLLNGPYRRAMARNVEIRNAILIPMLDSVSLDIVHFDGRRSPAAGILAHEIMHSMVQRRIGLVAAWRLPWWKREGYAEYVAADSGKSSAAPPAYQRAMRYWKHLLEQCHMRAEDVLRRELSPPPSMGCGPR